MRQLTRRLDALEAKNPAHLSPAMKAWLGYELTEQEQREMDESAGVDRDVDSIDTSNWSKEMKAWLGVD